MAPSLESLGIDRLTVHDRIELVTAIWDSIAKEPAALPVSDAVKAELDRRLQRHKTHPEEVIDWEGVLADQRERYGA